MALTPRGLTRPPQAHTHPTHMHTHAPARHPLGPLPLLSEALGWAHLCKMEPAGWCSRQRTPSKERCPARPLCPRPPRTTAHSHGPSPRVPLRPPPAWQCCSAQAGKGGFRGYRPQPCQDICLCPQKGEAGGWSASPLPQSQAAAHPQAPQASALPRVGLGRKAVKGSPRACPSACWALHSPVSR